MNMQIKAKEYQPGQASQIPYMAKAVRDRIWPSKPPVNANVNRDPDAPRLTSLISLERALERNEDPKADWIAEEPFSAHVKAYVAYVASQRFMSSPAKNYLRQRCLEIGMPLGDVTNTVRTMPTVRLRQILMYEVRRKFGMGYPTLSGIFNRDTTTILHAIRYVQNMIDNGYLSTVFDIYQPGTLTAEMMAQIDVDRHHGMKPKDIAEKYGVTMTLVKKFSANVSATKDRQTNWKRTRDATEIDVKDAYQKRRESEMRRHRNRRIAKRNAEIKAAWGDEA